MGLFFPDQNDGSEWCKYLKKISIRLVIETIRRDFLLFHNWLSIVTKRKAIHVDVEVELTLSYKLEENVYFIHFPSHPCRLSLFGSIIRTLTYSTHTPAIYTKGEDSKNERKKNTSRRLLILLSSTITVDSSSFSSQFSGWDNLRAFLFFLSATLCERRHWQNVKAILEECRRTHQKQKCKGKKILPFIIHFVCLKIFGSEFCALPFFLIGMNKIMTTRRSGWVKELKVKMNPFVIAGCSLCFFLRWDYMGFDMSERKAETVFLFLFFFGKHKKMIRITSTLVS